MSQTVHDRREALWQLLDQTPEGLTREEIAEQMSVSSSKVKTDLRHLSADGRIVLRQGGSVDGQSHTYRRAWFAASPDEDTATPLYDALLLAVENGASMTLTADLLRNLRADLRGVGG